MTLAMTELIKPFTTLYITFSTTDHFLDDDFTSSY
jgi:hypothetical protein